jgi:hypothetical protein
MPPISADKTHALLGETADTWSPRMRGYTPTEPTNAPTCEPANLRTSQPRHNRPRLGQQFRRRVAAGVGVDLQRPRDLIDRRGFVERAEG